MMKNRHGKLTGVVLASLFVVLVTAWPCSAQVDVQAVAGSPYGVGKVTVALPQGRPLAPATDDRFVVLERTGRALYPVLEGAPVRRVLRQLLGVQAPRSATMYFLFTGDEPLELTIFSPDAHARKVAVRRGPPAAHERLLHTWWREYTHHTERLLRSGEYPALVENYLTATLARRLNLEVPGYVEQLHARGKMDRAVGLMLGAESIRTAMQADTLLRNVSSREPADRPLPQPFTPPAIDFSPPAEDVAVEPIALHVPQECLYVRFGSFTNYLWLRGFLGQWSGDLQNMIAVRGLDYGINKRLERQLSLHESVLSKVLGPAVISDVAIIAGDTFMREGASLGILFQARNNLALSTSIRSQRREAIDTVAEATEQTLTIAGHEVSLVATPDNSVRSFYASDGDYHLVTTSSAMVRRFFEAGQGKASLGASDEFRHARAVMPLERDDTVFVYLSDALFRELVSPHYRVEMTRRMRSAGDIELVEVARLAAKAEGHDATSIDQLIAAGFLPKHFDDRPDGSGIVDEDGGLIDSLRGAPGTFLPVGDAIVDRITASEASAYREFARFYRDEWERMDPVMIGIGRESLAEADRERITLDVQITPYAKAHYGTLASWLGPATKEHVAPVPGDMVSGQLVLAKDSPDGQPQLHHIFAGLRDSHVPVRVRGGKVSVEGFGLTSVRGYVGSWPRVGLLGLLLDRNAGEPDRDGYTQTPVGVWQRDVEPFRVISLKRDVLEEVTPHLSIREAERPAQARLWVGDLSSAELATAINAFGYMRAYQTSVAGSRFINALSRQLHVPPADGLATAERLMRGRLVCALGGKYALEKHDGGLDIWNSTAHHERNRFLLTGVPEDYQFPLLSWFRGLRMELSLTGTVLAARAELDVQRDSQGGPLQLFSLPGSEK